MDVYANGCEWLGVCELQNNSWNYVTGSVSLTGVKWIKKTNLVNGSSIYEALGYRRSSRLERNYTPVPRNFASYPLQQIEISLAAKESSRSKENPISVCRRACSGGNGASCLPTIAESPALSSQLQHLDQLALSKPVRIRALNLRAMFGLSDDPCERGDTIFAKGHLENDGDQCELQAQIPDSIVKIAIPSRLRGSWAASSSSVEAVFGNAKTRAHLSFTNSDLNADYGADIVGLYADSKHLTFALSTKKCVKLSFK